MRFARGGKITVNFDGLVRPASRLGYQIIRRRIQQIFLHFCKPTSGGVVNSLGLAQSVDRSILFVQLYEQTIQGLYNALSLSSVDALSPDPRVDVLQCLQKRHSPCHEMDWVGFY